LTLPLPGAFRSALNAAPEGTNFPLLA